LFLVIKRRYTRPYRRQPLGKVERFWRPLDDDVIEGGTFDYIDHFAISTKLRRLAGKP